MIFTIILRLIIHVFLIGGLNRIARKSRWGILVPLSFLVSGFLILLNFAIPAITPSELMTVSGNLESTGRDKNGWFVIYLNNHTLQFVVPDDDEKFFLEDKFLSEIQVGDPLNLSILKRVENSDEVYRIVFDIESKGFYYLSHEPLIESRLHERNVTIPIVIAISILLSLSLVLAWRMPNPISDLALSACLGTLIMLVIDTLFHNNSVPSMLPIISLVFIYPIIWVFENWRRPLQRKDWLLNMVFYILMIGLAAFSYIITLQ
ncbi:hypothetical protein LARV_00542 [Longilinea arvoryzae]|uniref:Uncharacterized protein n=1 Tax=Longilinea arvoryzae TaxID=360412 RepID=A0A0S7BEH8_9CHLR|nr:hypothetical protein [Longilinea arvoryzae]GAP12806.1 hypothetical protein LARV_00542 [Longilinea arvoryzae]